MACYAGHLDIVEYLSDNGLGDINVETSNGKKALHLAAEQGHLEVVKHLVERKGCDINVKNDNNKTPLHLACTNVHFSEHDTDTRHLDTVRYLISNELCDINAKDKKGRTVAHLAVKSGSFEVLKILCERGCSDEDGNSLLHYACSRKGSTSLDKTSNINLIKFLVSQPGCNIDEVNNDGEHVLHILCKYDSDPNIIKYLISEKHCSINVFDSHGNHPLHLACKAWNIEHVIALTSSPNCDVDVINHLNGLHPLHILCLTNTNDIAVEIEEHLIKKKQCDLNVCNESGYTPLGLACKTCNMEMVKLLTDETRCNINEGIPPLHISYPDGCYCWYDGFVLLINKPSCDINVQDSDGNTLLHLACKRDDYFMVKRLISHPKCDINILDKNNETPLFQTFRSSKYSVVHEIVELLLETNKCDVNIHGIDGNTALHYVCERASFNDSLKLVKLLTASPLCDINAENNEGLRPIHVAAKRTTDAILQHLINCGCDVNVCDLHGNTPLHQACGDQRYGLQLVKLLIPVCDINAENNEGVRPIHLAIRHDNYQILEHLVNCGCDVNVCDVHGNTPLHQSCRTTKWYCIQLIKLLTPVCDINAENNEGARPIHLAAQYDNLEVVCHLVDCGCDVAAKDKQGRNPVDYSKKSTKVNEFLNHLLYGTSYKSELYFI